MRRANNEIKLVTTPFLQHTMPNMKLKQPASLPILEKGQLWKTKTARVEIMDMGKLLAHYRYYTDGRTRVLTTMARVRVIQEHLQANGGKLVKNDRLKVSA
jgi:hypothetical protein